MELRGLIYKQKRKYGASWKWFWGKVNIGFSPHLYYGYPNEAKFEDRELLPYMIESPYFFIDKKGRKIHVPPLPWHPIDLTRFTPEELLEMERNYILRKDLKTERGKKNRLKKVIENLEKGIYEKVTPWIKEIIDGVVTPNQKKTHKPEESGFKSERKFK